MIHCTTYKNPFFARSIGVLLLLFFAYGLVLNTRAETIWPEESDTTTLLEADEGENHEQLKKTNFSWQTNYFDLALSNLCYTKPLCLRSYSFHSIAFKKWLLHCVLVI